MQRSLLRFVLPFALGAGLLSCTTDTADGGWEEPTTGVITTVREVNAGNFKIASEEPVPSVADSRIIIQPLDGQVDTLTLAEAKAISASQDTTTTRSRGVRSGGLGFFGYMMLGRMMGGGINRGAYVNGAAYNRANSTTGSTMRSSARRVGGASRNTGFGSGRSTRSVGG